MVALETGLTSYLLRAVIALAVMVLFAVAFVFVAKNKGWGRQNKAFVEILASLPLGRDAFVVVRCGPDVIAFISGKTGTSFMGRWKYEEWILSEEKSDRTEVPAEK